MSRDMDNTHGVSPIPDLRAAAEKATASKRSAYEPRMKAGPLRNGWERGHGSVFHAVPVSGHDNVDALCGTYPSIMWSEPQP